MTGTAMGDLIARFDAEAFRFISRFVGKEETRYYLTGVLIEPIPALLGGGVVLVATDGARMGIYWDRGGRASRKALIPTPNHSGFDHMLDALLKTSGAGDISIRGGMGPDLRVCTTHMQPNDVFEEVALGREIMGAGAYPNWRKVVPWDMTEDIRPTRADFNWAILEAFAEPFFAWKIDEDTGEPRPSDSPRQPVLLGGDPTHPHLVLRHDMPDFLGVVMPLAAPTSLNDSDQRARMRQHSLHQLEELRRLRPAPEGDVA